MTWHGKKRAAAAGLGDRGELLRCAWSAATGEAFADELIRLVEGTGRHVLQVGRHRPVRLRRSRPRPRRRRKRRRRSAPTRTRSNRAAHGPHRRPPVRGVPGGHRGLRHHRRRPVRRPGVPRGRQVFPDQQRPVLRELQHPQVRRPGVEQFSSIPARPAPGSAATPLAFDKWIPSVLFLTHYLPDDPADKQLINIASLILGQNGIWGDLLDGLAGGGRALRPPARPLQAGARRHHGEPPRCGSAPVGGEPGDAREDRRRDRPRGVVAFASAPGTYRYVTTKPVAPKFQATPGATVEIDAAGRADVEFAFDKPGAKIVFFGVKP